MDNDKKQWRARVVTTVSARCDDGQLISIQPGEYTLTECDGARYQLLHHADTPAYPSLWFAEVLQCAYTGKVEILGVWP